MKHVSADRSLDSMISTASGTLYVRQWPAPDSSAANRAPIVLLHDSLGCVDLWRDFPERLSAVTGRTVIAYDRLGFGRSDAHPGTLASTFIQDEAQDGFQPLRDWFGIETFILFGHSVGGGMAVACAASQPGCLGVVTASAQSFVEDRTVAGIIEAQQLFSDPTPFSRLVRYHGTKARWVLDAWIDTWLAPDFAGWNLDSALSRLTCPLLALHGDRDEYGSLAHPERMAARAVVPVDIHVLPDCGHVPHRDATEAVLERVRQWSEVIA